mmetsp:Transcript_8062/g.22899  ORF Transcript_8062/g.22899 Transcript_8062/m.22899 type:complete len:111 (+) Transcript_8062:1313-1645(+)
MKGGSSSSSPRRLNSPRLCVAVVHLVQLPVERREAACGVVVGQAVGQAGGGSESWLEGCDAQHLSASQDGRGLQDRNGAMEMQGQIWQANWDVLVQAAAGMRPLSCRAAG